MRKFSFNGKNYDVLNDVILYHKGKMDINLICDNFTYKTAWSFMHGGMDFLRLIKGIDKEPKGLRPINDIFLFGSSNNTPSLMSFKDELMNRGYDIHLESIEWNDNQLESDSDELLIILHGVIEANLNSDETTLPKTVTN